MTGDRPDRDRDASGRARNQRPRDGLGRPLAPDATGVPVIPDDLELTGPQTLQRAQQLLDDGMPFQAHEVLEARWKQCPPSERPFWQGLAQAAVALTHLRRGNTDGAKRVAGRALTNLATAGPPPVDIPAELTEQVLAVADGNDRGLRVLARSTPADETGGHP